MTPDPIDQWARSMAANELDRTLFFEAGAGTGKTSMLVARLVNLITTRKAHMEGVAAITFTEAAAAELRDRLIEELEKFDPTGTNDAVRDALSVIDGAAITTLHGFARRLLSEHPFAAGLPPVFEVADASASRVAFDERWDQFVNQLLTGPDQEELVVRALSCGLQWPQLRLVARQCEENWDRLEPVPIGSPPPPVEAASVRRYVEAAIGFETHCRHPEDKLLLHLRTKVRLALDLLRGSESEPIDALQTLIGLPKLSCGLGLAANWTSTSGTNHKLDVCSLLEAAEDEKQRVIDDTVQWTLRELFGLLVTNALMAATQRRAAGRLMFHDLLVLASRLLRESAEARQQLHARYTHILIDEFQDTDPIQAELAMYLAAGPAADSSLSWFDLPVEAGRLFFVGDPKQSIYRFRRADIEVFLTTRDHVVGQPEHLVTNFRSRPGIVDWVNAMFGELFAPGTQPAYQALVADEDRGTANPRGLQPVIVLGRTPIEANADGVRAAQAAEVASALANMHAEQWPVRHGDDPPTPLRYADVAILVPARTGMDILEDALRAAGIPFRLESSSLVYESQEVRQLLSLLRAIDDPTDAVSVVAALRSPAFGCGDDDLLAHVATGGRWDTRTTHEGTGVVAEGLARLHEYHDQRWWSGVSTFIGRVIVERHLLEVALVDERPRESWRRIRFVLDQARVFEENGGGDLRAFLRWVSHQQDDDARVTEVVLPENDDDAVRISTIHAAKGLEFPVTVLLGLQRGGATERTPLLFGTRPELYLNKLFATGGYEELHQIEREMDLGERIRLLYVAATRACDVLLVSLHRKADRKDKLAERVAELCEKFPALWSDGADLSAVVPTVAVVPAAPPSGPDGESREAFVMRRNRLLERAAVPRVVPATGLARLRQLRQGAGAAPDPEDGSLMEAEEGTVQRRGRAGTAVGRAVHGVLQLVDLSNGEGVEALARSQAAVEGVRGREREVRELARVALGSELVNRAVKSDRYWREVYLGTPIGERVLEGFIDLLFETPEGLWIVDYKTDQLRHEEDAGKVARRYRPQGAAYALAARAVLGQEIAGCSFLFLRTAGAVEVSIPDLPDAMAEVHALLTNSSA